MSNPQLAGLFGFTFGSYNFPATFQLTKQSTALALDKQVVPFNYGEHAPANTNSKGRLIELKGAVGSLIVGSGGGTLSTIANLEAERRLLAGLQIRGRQVLQLSADVYVEAFLETFDASPWQDGFGRRYADWTLTFWVDDPRYFATTPSGFTATQTAAATVTVTGITTAGNARAYPSFKFAPTSGTNVGPFVEVQDASSKSIVTIFSLLTMSAGDTLTIDCDPRPNHRSAAAIYTPSGGLPLNALQFCAPVTDFLNTIDPTEWFPFLDPTDTGLKILYGYTGLGSGSYAFTAAWQDRFM